ncbi:hypothetical protein [Flexivirga alba]|uniref:Transposase n=1 Tax=Flexivirga alba TaxID=702742 RepID=A0ABW2AKB9_9MICO
MVDQVRNRVQAGAGHDPGFAPQPIACEARFEWESDDLVEWVPGRAVKWKSDRVLVSYRHRREDDDRQHFVWLQATDVRRADSLPR